jgi:diadenylate cyclase
VLNFIQEIIFIFQRLTWTSILDISLVTVIFFAILMLVRKTQAMTLLRGVISLLIAVLLITQIVNLPAFRWLVLTAMPTMLFAVPVVFAPEIRRGLERLGRAGSNTTSIISGRITPESELYEKTMNAILNAVNKLSERKHGALLVFQRHERLDDYVSTGVLMGSRITTELLLQIFYPNTPLHDGAVIINNVVILASSCVLPLSSSGVLNDIADRKMGLRHRAALGISEASDAFIVVVSEETGNISIAQQGELRHNISLDDLLNDLQIYYEPPARVNWLTAIQNFFQPGKEDAEEDDAGSAS